MMMNTKAKKSNMGFVMLFAVTLSAILLSIALGVANIAFREAKFSANARDTNDAFFAADTGIESVLFSDKNGELCPPVNGSSSCLYPVAGLGDAGVSCANVTMSRATDASGNVTIKVVSKGYNNGGGGNSCIPNVNSVERQIEVNY